MVNNKSDSSLKKTKYKYTYKTSDGKFKKLPVFRTNKGKYIVFINDKKKYVNPINTVKGGGSLSDTWNKETFESLLYILKLIPAYFERNSLFFMQKQRGGTQSSTDLTIAMRNFMNHPWTNENQKVHFTNLNHKNEALKLIAFVFMMFFNLYVLWNYNIIFNFFNPKFAERIPMMEQMYTNIEHLIQSIGPTPFDGETIAYKTILDGINIGNFFAAIGKTEKFIESYTEFLMIMLINVFSIIMSFYFVYKLLILNIQDIINKSGAGEINKESVKQLIQAQEKAIVNSGYVLQPSNTTKPLALTTKKVHKLLSDKVLTSLFYLYSNTDFSDIETFDILAQKVDNQLDNFLKTKYSYVLQPNNSYAMATKLNINTNALKPKLESISELLHAMHDAQIQMLISMHNPVEIKAIENGEQPNELYTAYLLHEAALNKFKDTYQKITGKQIKLEENDDGIIQLIEIQLQQEGGGKNSTKNTTKNSTKKQTISNSKVKNVKRPTVKNVKPTNPKINLQKTKK